MNATQHVHNALGFPTPHAIPFVANIFVDVSDVATPELDCDADSVESYLPGYDYRARFPEMRTVFNGEGGVVFAASGPGEFAVISDESMLNDMIGEDLESVVIRVFATEVARDAYLRERGW